MVKCIKFNCCKTYFSCIILTILLRYFNLCLFGYNYDGAFVEVNFFKFFLEISNNTIKINLSDYKITEFMLNFFGAFILSIISRFVELHFTGNKLNKFFQLNEQALFQKNQCFKKLAINNFSIEIGNRKNVLYKFKNYLVNNSSVFIYFFISFIWVVQEILMVLFAVFLKDIDFWFFEILIVTIFFSNIFLVEVYKHQKLAIGINLIPCNFKIITIIFRFKSTEQTIYTKYPGWIPAGLIGYLILISINAFINCSIKSFIDLKYITISQLLIFYSFIGIIVCIITDVIFTFVPCSENINLGLEHIKICNIEYHKSLYFDNFMFYFSSFHEENLFGKLIRTLFIIFDFTSFFFKEYFYLSVIKYMGPIHITFALPIFFFLKKIVLVMNNLIINSTFITDASKNKLYRFFLDISGDIVCIIGFLIYLEIIEIKCFDLDFNLRKYIIQRGNEVESSLELKAILHESDEDNITQEIDDFTHLN